MAGKYGSFFYPVPPDDMRCQSRLREGKRSWRCGKLRGHDQQDVSGLLSHVAAARLMHSSHSGGRRWQ